MHRVTGGGSACGTGTSREPAPSLQERGPHHDPMSKIDVDVLCRLSVWSIRKGVRGFLK